MRPNENISMLVRALAGYLHANPRASDTCEGVLAWWLGRDSGATSKRVQTALDTLVDRGVVERVVAADGRVRYRRSCDDEATHERLAELARDGFGNQKQGST